MRVDLQRRVVVLLGRRQVRRPALAQGEAHQVVPVGAARVVHAPELVERGAPLTRGDEAAGAGELVGGGRGGLGGRSVRRGIGGLRRRGAQRDDRQRGAGSEAVSGLHGISFDGDGGRRPRAHSTKRKFTSTTSENISTLAAFFIATFTF